MRQGPHQKRGRGRGNRRPNTPNRNQTFDSNGPDVRIRGNASQVYEKYLNLARDATASGDRVLAESYYQHAEHYYRIIAAFQDSQGGENRGQPGHGSPREWDQDDDDRESGDERNDGGERGNGSDRGEQNGRGDRLRADNDRGGDPNRNDRFGRDRGDRDRGDRDRGDRDRGERGDRDRNERDRGGDRRPMRAEGHGEDRRDQPAAAAAPAVTETPAATEAPVSAPPAATEAPAGAPAVEAPAAPRGDGNDADGIRRTLRLTPSRPAAGSAPEKPVEAAAEPAGTTEAEPERKPRRRRASPKANDESSNNSEGFVAAPVIDDDGAVAAS